MAKQKTELKIKKVSKARKEAEEGIVKVTEENKLEVIEAIILVLHQTANDGVREKSRIALTNSGLRYIQARANHFGISSTSVNP